MLDMSCSKTIQAFLLLGIVFLMTNKPPLPGAGITVAIALAAGLASAAPLWWGRGGKMKQKWLDKTNQRSNRVLPQRQVSKRQGSRR